MCTPLAIPFRQRSLSRMLSTWNASHSAYRLSALDRELLKSCSRATNKIRLTLSRVFNTWLFRDSELFWNDLFREWKSKTYLKPLKCYTLMHEWTQLKLWIKIMVESKPVNSFSLLLYGCIRMARKWTWSLGSSQIRDRGWVKQHIIFSSLRSFYCFIYIGPTKSNVSQEHLKTISRLKKRFQVSFSFIILENCSSNSCNRVDCGRFDRWAAKAFSLIKWNHKTLFLFLCDKIQSPWSWIYYFCPPCKLFCRKSFNAVKGGTRLFSLPDSVRPIWSGRFSQGVSVRAISITGHFRLAISVWRDFGRDISVHKQLITFVH